MARIVIAWPSDGSAFKKPFLIEQTLKPVGGNKTNASELLGIRRTLRYRKMIMLGIDR